MNVLFFAVGLAKVLFGFLVAALGIVLAFKLLDRMLASHADSGHEKALLRSNSAAGTLHAASLLSLGLLAQNAVRATFDAIDLTIRSVPIPLSSLLKLFAFATGHVVLTLLVGVGVLASGVWLFGRMTPGIDELKEVDRGNVAAALVLGAILIVLALLTAPGLQSALEQLIPFPSLPPRTVVQPQ
jgi:uncharacterized membrane protein YjfL (UPF0719 family)